jgi:hypothetical protein
MFNQIRNIAFANKMKQAIVKSKSTYRKMKPLEAVKNIGFLFDASDEYTFIQIEHFAAKFPNAKVDYLGFINVTKKKMINKEIPFNCFFRDEVNFNFTANSSAVTKFVNQPFDLLLNLSLKSNPTLHHICALSKAKFRVGSYYETYTDAYEMMVTQTDNAKQEDLLAQILIQLNNFNT